MSVITLSEAQAEIATRLGDEGNVFWTANELYAYLCEALQVLNALTAYWKTEFTFTLTPPFTTNWFPANAAGSPRQQTLTDTDLYKLIEYHLLEPPTGATWTGTDQFAITDLWQAMSRRRNEILQMAACNVVELTLNCIPRTSTIAVPDSAMDVRRVRWVPATGQGSPVTLQRGDILSYQRFTPNYPQTDANPLRWTLLNGLEASLGHAGSLLALQLDTLVNVPSTVQALTVAGGPDFNPPGGNPLLLPNDWAWVLKFGTLADVLSKEEEGRDVPRATYCRQRYAEGLKAMMTLPWITQAQLQGVAVDAPALASADRFNYEWQSRATAFPGIVVGGIDLFAISPVPTGLTSVDLTVVQNAPLPANTPSAPIFLSRDAVEAVLKEATHLALFKCGGQEFAESIALHREFTDYCTMTNSLLFEAGIFPTDYTPVLPRIDEQQPRFTMQGGD